MGELQGHRAGGLQGSAARGGATGLPSGGPGTPFVKQKGLEMADEELQLDGAPGSFVVDGGESCVSGAYCKVSAEIHTPMARGRST